MEAVMTSDCQYDQSALRRYLGGIESKECQLALENALIENIWNMAG